MMVPQKRDQNMAAQKVKTQSSNLENCDKCGSIMAIRKIAMKNGGTEVKWVKIFQCIVCKHWIPYE